MGLPESVKSTEVNGFIAAGGALEGHAFDVKLADDEVMILKQLQYWWYSTLVAGANIVHFGLWRKTDSDPPANIWDTGEAQSMVWHRLMSTFYAAAASVDPNGFDTIDFPYPIILIRAPRCMVMTQTMTNFAWSMRLYYSLYKVTARELAELMVKDHH